MADISDALLEDSDRLRRKIYVMAEALKDAREYADRYGHLGLVAVIDDALSYVPPEVSSPNTSEPQI